MSKKNVLYSNLDSSCIKLICSKILNTDDSQRAIARQANVSARTVRRFAERLKKHEITKYSEIAELTPLEVYKKLYDRKVSTLVLKSDNDKFIPDFGRIVAQMIENRQQSIKLRYQEYCIEAESSGKIPLSLSYFSAGAKDISRFDSARQFQAFFGYHTCHSGSGGKVVMGKMASNGDRAVKRNLYESALSVYHQGKCNNEPRSEWIASKTEQNRAAFKKGMICIGSKILRTSYGVLKSGKPYNPAVDNSLGRMKSRLHRRSNPKYREQGLDAVLQSQYEQELSLTALD